MTDMFASALKLMGGRCVDVDFSDEPKTGADLELIFKDQHRSLKFLIQAKRSSSDNPIDFDSYKYKKLKYKTAGKNQIDQLIDFANKNKYLPLYMFYNSKKASKLFPKGHKSVCGVDLILAQDVKKIMKEKHYHNYGHIKHYTRNSFELKDIFCPSQFKIAVFANAHAMTIGPLIYDSTRRVLGFSSPPKLQNIINRITELSAVELPTSAADIGSAVARCRVVVQCNDVMDAESVLQPPS